MGREIRVSNQAQWFNLFLLQCSMAELKTPACQRCSFRLYTNLIIQIISSVNNGELSQKN